MIIDGHAHACGRFLTADDIIKTLDDCGVDKVILVPGELNSKAEYSLPNLAALFPRRNVIQVTNYFTKFLISVTGKGKEIPAGNEHVYELKEKTQGRVIQFIWMTTRIEHPSDYLDNKFSRWNFQGVKLHQCWENFSIDSSFFLDVASWVESKGLPLFIHLYSRKEAARLIAYKRNHPKLKLIVAHLFALELFIKENFKDENLYFDASPPQLISIKRLMMAISFLGADRILLGTDTPYGKDNIRINIDRIKNLEISGAEKELILGKNMARLLNIC